MQYNGQLCFTSIADTRHTGPSTVPSVRQSVECLLKLCTTVADGFKRESSAYHSKGWPGDPATTCACSWFSPPPRISPDGLLCFCTNGARTVKWWSSNCCECSEAPIDRPVNQSASVWETRPSSTIVRTRGGHEVVALAVRSCPSCRYRLLGRSEQRSAHKSQARDKGRFLVSVQVRIGHGLSRLCHDKKTARRASAPTSLTTIQCLLIDKEVRLNTMLWQTGKRSRALQVDK